MHKLLALAFAAGLALVPATSSAQEAGGGGGGGGGGGTRAGNSAFGLGVQSMLRGPAGAAVTYDTGLIHIDGIFFFVDSDGGFLGGGDDSFGIGARAFYSIHQSSAADFGLGGGLGITVQDEGGDNNDTLLSLEFGAKMRAFIVTNVALTAFVGLGVVVDTDDEGGNDDEDAFVLGGQQVGALGSAGVLGGFGFTYYFN